MGAGVSLAGGQVILTSEYLVFTPWDLTQTREWLGWLASQAGVPYVGEVDKLLTKSKILEPVAISLGELANVQVLNRAKLFKPPTARLQLRNGSHFDVGILASVGTPNLSSKNNVAFDDFYGKVIAAAG